MCFFLNLLEISIEKKFMILLVWLIKSAFLWQDDEPLLEELCAEPVVGASVREVDHNLGNQILHKLLYTEKMCIV